MKIRSMVGLIPLYACSILDDDVIEKLPAFKRKLEWFKKYRDDLAQEVSTGSKFNFKAYYSDFMRSKNVLPRPTQFV